MSRQLIMVLCLLLLASAAGSQGLHPSYSPHAPIDTVPFFPGGTYTDAVPSPNLYLQHEIGQWPLRYYELEDWLGVLAGSTERVKILSDGETYEGRTLYNVFISSPENIRKIEEIRLQIEKLANSPSLAPGVLDSIAGNVPAIAWLGYSIHGDEISGTDAATRLIYQLAAGTDSVTMKLLNELVIIIQPSQNPDGRERYLSMLQTYRSAVPNWDRFAMQHSGVWPWGRTNHYLFDMNRDWVLLRLRETQHRMATLLKWNPQLVVDGHEMGSNETFLFSPPREPINYNTPEHYLKWADKFAEEQASAFDERAWPYYTGEWHEHWYPGYCSAWPTYVGAVGVLYEMAGVDGQVVRQRDNYLLSYHEAVNKQFTSSIANLTTLANNRVAFLREYYDARRGITEQGRRSGLTFLYRPIQDEVKMKRFVESLTQQGIKVTRSTEAFTVSQATNRAGDAMSSVRFPAGTYIVSTAQPHGALAKAVLEFDPKLNLEFLKEERRELEKFGETRMYEVSSWTPSLAYDLDAYYTRTALTVPSEPVNEVALSSGILHDANAQFGFIVPMVGEKTYQMLVRLFQEEVVIRASEKPFRIGGREYAPGSLLLRKRGNGPELVAILGKLAAEIGLDVYGVETGYSESGSMLGAGTFRLLKTPRVGIVAGNGIDYTSFGTLWFALDQELQIPHSILNVDGFGWNANLEQYNVLILPSSWGPMAQHLGESGKSMIETWVKDGGTLICLNDAAAWAADSSVGLSQVRLKRQVLDKLDEYKLGLKRERQAEAPEVDTIALWYPERVKPDTSAEEKKDGKMSLEDARDLDAWQRKFSPQGAILKATLDPDAWMAFGMGDDVPVMLYSSYAFLAKSPVKTVARFADINDVRMSGLLWPEARERIANTAYATCESNGRGQVILFAADPHIRAYFFGTRQLFVNALLYGPGMGSRFEGPYEQ